MRYVLPFRNMNLIRWPIIQDAHEFFVFVLDQIQREIASLRDTPGAGFHGEGFLTDAFSYRLCQSYKCESCKRTVDCSEDGNHIFLQCGEQDENL
jgi:uncharacterized UBP type Zn finger protein